jgi:aspartate aminotransferase-like enzyme
MSRPIIPHRSEVFEAFYGKILDGLRYLFQCQNGAVCTIASSGTGGVEAAMYSLFGKGDTVAVVSNGKFSECWGRYADSLGCKTQALRLPWGTVPSTTEIIELAKVLSLLASAHKRP